MITTRAVSAPLPRPHVAAAQRPLNATLPTPWPAGPPTTWPCLFANRSACGCPD